MSTRNYFYNILKQEWEKCLETSYSKIQEEYEYVGDFIEKNLHLTKLNSEVAIGAVFEADKKGYAKKLFLDIPPAERTDTSYYVFDKENFEKVIECHKELIKEVFESDYLLDKDRREYMKTMLLASSPSDNPNPLLSCSWTSIEDLFELYYMYKITNWEKEMILVSVS